MKCQLQQSVNICNVKKRKEISLYHSFIKNLNLNNNNNNN